MTAYQTPSWSPYLRIAFRITFLYFFLQVLPLDANFFHSLGSLQYEDIFNLAHYAPHFGAGSQQFTDWIILFVIALAGAAIWTVNGRFKNTDDASLYYWLRVLLRYRLALALFAYGFIKFFPLLAPYPSLSNLNTPYGDFNRWKLFSLSLGIVPSYELFLGGVEILIGLLLLNRRTASIGAFIFLIFAGNVFMSNLAYEGGDIVFSLYLITLAFFILSVDIIRIVDVIIFQRPTAAATFRPAYSNGVKYGRIVLKSLFVLVFVIIYGFKTGAQETLQFPETPGLPGSAGIYNVSSFVLGQDTLNYSQTDSSRWQDVVFEKWNTISIRDLHRTIIDSSNEHKALHPDEARNYESEGTNGRHYYSYSIDSIQHVLTLHNKNAHYPKDTWVLHYTLAEKGKIVLAGLTPGQDSIQVVLDRINKKYLLEEAAKTGRNKHLKL